MTDCYEYSNDREDIPQTKYLFVNSSWSDGMRAISEKYINEFLEVHNDAEARERFGDWYDTLIRKVLNDERDGLGFWKWFNNSDNNPDGLKVRDVEKVEEIAEEAPVEVSAPAMVENAVEEAQADSEWDDAELVGFDSPNGFIKMGDRIKAIRETNAFRNVSFSPEKRIESVAKEYQREASEIHALCQKYGIPAEKYLDKHYRLTMDWLGSQSRCASWMITGRSKFPAEMMNKRSDWAHNKMGKLVYFLENFERILKKITRTVETQDDKKANWTKQIEKRKGLQEMMKDVNKMIRAGKKEEAEQKYNIQLKANCFGRIGFERFELTNNLANIKRLEDQIAQIERTRSRGEGFEFDGGKVEFDAEEIRFNIHFDDIPDVDLRGKLKHNGFKWSPRRQAWTRGAKTISIARIKELLEVA